MFDTEQLKKNKFFSRIVFKFRDSFFSQTPEGKKDNYFFYKDDIEWQLLLMTFPGISINKLFTSLSSEEINVLVNKAEVSDPIYPGFDFTACYAINCPQNISAVELLTILQSDNAVAWAYLQKNPGVLPSVSKKDLLQNYQGYLNAAPVGIDARYAWQFKGGKGDGIVKFIDIEQGWLMNHEDLPVHTLPCTGINHFAFGDHGAAVLGIIMLRNNNAGGSGIIPHANVYVVSQWRTAEVFNTDDAIMAAINHLGFGDILLLESQVVDPLINNKLWPVEIQHVSFEVIRLATALGIIVIEAGGNGDMGCIIGNDLNQYEIKKKKIFNPNSADFRDSGAIMVAAASDTVPHNRIYYSNYGSRINCYSWGENVVTAGLYPRSSGIVINSYSSAFGGTSSAAAIIAGAAMAVQSIMESNNNHRLSPAQMRNILSNELYGTPSANGHSIDKIGVMPDLKKIADFLLSNGAAEKSI